jgi:cytosine/adenosine deaminase-related metal-dependent hydrolase
MDRPVLRDAAVVFSHGRILAVGHALTLAREHPGADHLDLGRSLILPGLVNAHTHLELSHCACGDPPASFVDWILDLPRRIGRDRLTPEEIFPAAVRRGVRQCIRYGVTSVGDISQHAQLTRAVLRDGPLHCVSYGEALGIGRNRGKFDTLLEQATDLSAQSPWLRVGLSPHAPYSVERPDYERALRSAQQAGLPLATHLAELPYEAEFLDHHTGPFREGLEKLGLWRDDIRTFAGGPIRFAHAIGLLSYPTLLAHVNYCDDDDMALLAGGASSVVYCPRTHRYFGHAPHRWREMLRRGINVAVGTDSCASSPDLNLVDELRLVHRQTPEAPAVQLWEMGTIRGASAIGLRGEIGSLSVGKSADMVVFSEPGSEPLRGVLDQQILPTQVWIAGRLAGPATGEAALEARPDDVR